MTTATTDMRISEPRREAGVNRWLIVAVIALAAALVGLGAWVLVDQLSTPENDATALIDETMAAINAGDAAGAASTYAEDATLNLFGDVYTSRAAIERRYADATGVGTRIERAGDVIVSGDSAVTFAEWTNDLGMSETDISVFQLEDGLIKGHWEFIADEWPPPKLDG